jgi:hypothetical protein
LALDAPEFGAFRFVRSFNARYRYDQDDQDCVKVHPMRGVKTHIVTRIDVTGRHDRDFARSRPLIETASRTFRLKAVSADQGFATCAQVEFVNSKQRPTSSHSQSGQPDD